MENNWYIEPHNQLARERIVQFMTYLRSVSSSSCHPMLLWNETFSPPDLLNCLDKLVRWQQQPSVQDLLRVDIHKDFDLSNEEDRARLMLMREVRSTFCYYLKNVLSFHIGVGRRSSLTELKNLFVLIHKYKVLFELEQYGLNKLWKDLSKKLLDLISQGEFEFLLFFFEWFPEMATTEHYPLCTFLPSTFYIRLHENCCPTLQNLLDKHCHRFVQLYFQ